MKRFSHYERMKIGKLAISSLCPSVVSRFKMKLWRRIHRKLGRWAHRQVKIRAWKVRQRYSTEVLIRELHALLKWKYGVNDPDDFSAMFFVNWLNRAQLRLPEHFLRMARQHIEDFDEIRDELDRLKSLLSKEEEESDCPII